MSPLKLRRLAVLAALALAACRPTATPALTPTPATPTRAPTLTALVTTSLPAATGQPATRQPVATAMAPTLARFGWDDRSPFQAGLVESEHPVLDALPGATIYHINLAIGGDLATVTGHQAVRYTNREAVALDEIVFRLFPNLLGGSVKVASVSVDGAPARPAVAGAATALRVPLAAPLGVGQSVVVEMDFAVEVPAGLERNYGVLAAAGGVLALAHVFPLVAVYDAAGWNMEVPPEQGDVVYADASFFLVQVRAPASLVLAASGSAIDTQAAGREQIVTYALGPARDFYLVASAAYTTHTLAAGPVTITSYAPAALGGQAQVALETARAALAVYEASYGPYPYRELDLAATPTLALGIEYPGIIALTNKLFDASADFGGAPSARYLESTTAHEVAHQWFYNLVGNNQVDEPWLDESLTQYATLRFFEAEQGPSGAAAFRASLEGRWSRVDAAEIPIGLPVSAYQGPEYSAIVYGRGPLFFEALAQAMGPEAFNAFLSDYARRYRWEIVTGQALKDLAETHCGCNLTPLFEQWVWP